MSSSSILIPLSSVDQAGVETSASVFAYVVLGSIDVDGLLQAAIRVVDKRLLLAGTVEYANKTYNVRVPLGPLPEGRVYFTTSSSTSPLGIVHPELNNNSSVALRSAASGTKTRQTRCPSTLNPVIPSSQFTLALSRITPVSYLRSANRTRPH